HGGGAAARDVSHLDHSGSGLLHAVHAASSRDAREAARRRARRAGPAGRRDRRAGIRRRAGGALPGSRYEIMRKRGLSHASGHGAPASERAGVRGAKPRLRDVKITSGKLAGMKAVSDGRGVIAAAAMDQRGSLQKALAKERGGDVAAKDLEEFKILV